MTSPWFPLLCRLYKIKNYNQCKVWVDKNAYRFFTLGTWIKAKVHCHFKIQVQARKRKHKKTIGVFQVFIKTERTNNALNPCIGLSMKFQQKSQPVLWIPST